jgi:hypothetical protein
MGLVFLDGCVSKSRYDAVTVEMNDLRAELLRAGEEIRALEQQRDAVQKLNLDGERLLAALRAEGQQARARHAEYQAEQARLEAALKAKAQALHSEHIKRVQEVKAAKREALKMQAVVDRYEKEMRELPDIGDMLKVSQVTDANRDSSRLMATVTPLPAGTSTTTNTGKTPIQPTPSPSIPSGEQTYAAISPPAPAGGTAQPLPASVQTSTATPAPAGAAPPSKSQPAPQEEYWFGTFTGWLSSLWGWLFS